MIYLGDTPIGIAVSPTGWVYKTVSVTTACTRADQVKTFIESVIGNSKNAFVCNNRDWTSMPTTNREFCSAILYNGFDESDWTRYNVSGSSGSYQTNNSHGVTNYWSSTYDMQLATGEELLFFYKP